MLHATASDTVASCSEARWICYSDSECSKALEYYLLFCKAMFKGRRCNERCKNSLSILRRQRQARKLEDCTCGVDEYMEEWKCSDVKRNTRELCMEKEEEVEEEEEGLEEEGNIVAENEVDTDGNGGKKSGAKEGSSAKQAVIINAVILTVYIYSR